MKLRSKVLPAGWKRTAWLLGILSVMVGPVFGLSGCSSNPGAAVVPQRPAGVAVRPVHPVLPATRPALPPVAVSPRSAPAPAVRSHPVDPLAVARLARSIRGVESSVAVIYGQTALIGAQIRRGLTPAQMTQVDANIRRRIMSAHPTIKDVRITTDRGAISQLNHMSKDIQNGKPLSTFAASIQRIFTGVPPVRIAR